MTSAVIVFEKLGKAIFVNADGSPEVVGPALRKLETSVGFEKLAETTDFRTLYGGVGVPAFDQPGSLTVKEGTMGRPYVADHKDELVSADFLYMVRADGEVVWFDDFTPVTI
jgi:hypothetical protein